MFMALTTSGTPIFAGDAIRGSEHICSDCRSRLVLKRGEVVRAHFAHEPNADCDRAGESFRHMEMKQTLFETFQSFRPTYEQPFITPWEKRRADIYIDPLKLVIENQASALPQGEWEQRTRFYNQIGLAVLWVWDGPMVALWHKGDRHISESIRWCHQMGYGFLHTLVDDTLYVAHLTAVERWNDFMGYSTTLKTRKHVEMTPANFRTFTRKSGPKGHVLFAAGNAFWWRPYP